MISSYRSNNSSNGSSSIDDDEKNNTLHKFGMPSVNDEGKGNKNNCHDETKNTSVSVVNGDISIQASNCYEVKNTSNITTATASEEVFCKLQKKALAGIEHRRNGAKVVSK
jgi:hypothetical protein